MKQLISVLMLVLAMMVAQAALAQEEMEDAEESAEHAMPAPLSEDNWYSWMAGEWEGETVSTHGKMNDWMSCEITLGGQFVVAHYKSKMVSMTKEAMEAMNITEEQFAAMKENLYTGMGVFTVDPQTGKSMNYWFDSMRNISTGEGSRKGNVETTVWTDAQNTATRTVEKVSDNELVMTFKGTSNDGMEFSGKTVMKRKAAMSAR